MGPNRFRVLRISISRVPGGISEWSFSLPCIVDCLCIDYPRRTGLSRVFLRGAGDAGGISGRIAIPLLELGLAADKKEREQRRQRDRRTKDPAALSFEPGTPLHREQGRPIADSGAGRSGEYQQQRRGFPDGDRAHAKPDRSEENTSE